MGRMIIMLALLTSMGLGTAKAQRCLPGQIGVEIAAGTVDGFILRDRQKAYSYWSGVSLTRYMNKGRSWNFGMEYLHKDYKYRTTLIPMSQYTGGVEYRLPLIGDRRSNFLLVVGVGALFGYETCGTDDKRLFDGATLLNGDSFIYVGTLSVQGEAFLTDRIIVMLRVRERFAYGSSIGAYHTQLSVGLRFIVN